MKNLLLVLLLTLSACQNVTPGNVPVQAEGLVAKVIERVIVRVEKYVEQPPMLMGQLDQALVDTIKAAAMVARTMLGQPEVSGRVLQVTLAPLMSLHDSMLGAALAGGELDRLEYDIYLEDTIRLTSLFDAVSIYEPAISN